MLIDKDQAINALKLLERKHERVRATLQADVVRECINEVEKVEETPPKFYLVDKGKK